MKLEEHAVLSRMMMSPDRKTTMQAFASRSGIICSAHYSAFVGQTHIASIVATERFSFIQPTQLFSFTYSIAPGN